MKKTKFKMFTISIKRNIIPAMFCLFTIGLVIFSKNNLQASKTGLLLFANSVLPSLLPFFIATELLSHTTLIYTLGNILNSFMRPIFNVPGEGVFPLLMGIISGYPTGAKIVTDFRENGILTKEESERLLSFTNNSGPLFIIGTVGGALFGNSTIGILLFVTHLLASITVGFIFRFWKRKKELNNRDYRSITNSSTLVSFSNLGSILSSSIMNSIKTIVMIGGFVVLFSVIVSILESSHILDVFIVLLKPIFKLLNIDPTYINSILTGIIELTNGAQKIALINTKAISINTTICSFLLGFGGISILLQVLSITSKSDISIKPYIIGKLLQACFAAFYTYIFIHNFMIFNFDL